MQRCEHKNVKFCKDCRNVYCMTCKREWDFEPCKQNHYPLNYPYIGIRDTTDYKIDFPLTTVTCKSHD